MIEGERIKLYHDAKSTLEKNRRFMSEFKKIYSGLKVIGDLSEEELNIIEFKLKKLGN